MKARKEMFTTEEKKIISDLEIIEKKKKTFRMNKIKS